MFPLSEGTFHFALDNEQEQREWHLCHSANIFLLVLSGSYSSQKPECEFDTAVPVYGLSTVAVNLDSFNVLMCCVRQHNQHVFISICQQNYC